MSDAPSAVLIVWWATLAAVVLIGVPAATLFLHRIWGASRAIRTYAADTRAAAEGIVRNLAPEGKD